MASLLDRLKAAVSIGNKDSWSHPAVQQKPQPRVNAQQLAQALQVLNHPAVQQHLVNAPQLPRTQLKVSVAPKQTLNVGNKQIAQNPNIRTQTPVRNAFLDQQLHPDLVSQVKKGLQEKLRVPIATAQQAQQMAQDFVTKPIAYSADSLRGTQHTYHPNSNIEKFVFGDKPIQNIEKNVKNNYDTHPNLPTPARVGLAGLDALAQVGMASPSVGGAVTGLGKGAKYTAETLHTATPKLIEGIQKLQKLDQNGFLNLNRAGKHPAVEAIDQHLKDLNTARDHLVAKNAPKTSIQANTKAYKLALQEKQRIIKTLKSRGGINNSSESLQPQLPLSGGDKNVPFPESKPNLASQGSDLGASSKASIPRSQLSGKALSTPNSELATPEQIGQSLGMSPEQVQVAKQIDPHTGLKSQANPEILPQQLKEKSPTPQTLPVRQDQIDSAISQPNSAGKSLSSSIPDLTAQIKNKNFTVGQKVGLHDYLRTPEKVLQKIGLHKEALALRQADHAYKSELPQAIDKITTWRKEVGNSPETSQRIFKWLDGQKGANLTGKELKVGNEIRSYLKEWADRLGLPADKRISNYITHIFDEKLIMKEFDPDLEKLIADKVPGSVYDPFTQQRLGAQGYKEDAFLALQAYVKRGTRKANFDPALEKLTKAAEGLDLHSWNYVKQYGDRINMRPTMLDNLIDTSLKQTPIGYKLGQRPVARISQGIRQATFRSALGLNVGSAVRNLTQGMNTFAELGTKYTGIGYTKALRAIAERDQELQKTGVLDNAFIEDRTVSAFKQGLQKLDNGLFVFFQTAEKINRGAAYYGAKAKALKEGKSLEQAVQEGVDTARKTQFTFGKVDTPVALQSDIVKLLTQFQSYNVKQIEFLAEMAKNKEYLKLLRFTGASAVVFGTVGQALGYRLSDMIPAPQVGQTPAIKAARDLPGAIQKHDAKSGIKLAKDTGSAFVPGFVQGKKSVTGVQAVNQGKVKLGNKTYPVAQTTSNKVKGAVFGPGALKPRDGQSVAQDRKTSQPGGTKSTGGYTKKEANALNPDRQQAWIKMSSKAKKNVAISNPKLYIDRQTKVIEQEKASGQTAKAFKDQRALDKVQVTKNYDRNTIEAYGLNSADFKAYVDQAQPDQITKLKELDQKLLDSGVITRSKFPKIKVGKAKKVGVGRKGRSKSFKSVAIKYHLPKGVKIGKLPRLKSAKSKQLKFKVATGAKKVKKIKLA